MQAFSFQILFAIINACRLIDTNKDNELIKEWLTTDLKLTDPTATSVVVRIKIDTTRCVFVLCVFSLFLEVYCVTCVKLSFVSVCSARTFRLKVIVQDDDATPPEHDEDILKVLARVSLSPAPRTTSELCRTSLSES